MKIEHIGIAVEDLEAGEKLYSALLNTSSYKREEVQSENVLTSFFKVGNSKIELLVPTSEDSVIAKFLSKKGPGIHHIAYLVEDIYSELDRLSNLGYKSINSKPKKGADGMLVAFLHPKETGGVLIELCQKA